MKVVMSCVILPLDGISNLDQWTILHPEVIINLLEYFKTYKNFFMIMYTWAFSQERIKMLNTAFTYHSHCALEKGM